MMTRSAASCWGLLAFGALALLLAGCAAPPTYAEVQATASVAGCWPDSFPTPRAVTVTPSGGLTATPTGMLPPGLPTVTALPTTTPLPRCPARPGATLVPWPTPVPPPPPYPTMPPRAWQTGADLQTTLHLPDTVLTVDLAAHPTDGWPAVASVVWSGTDDPERVFVSVLDPRNGTWGPARQVDVGASSLGRYTRTVAIAITGDDTVHAVWGASDPDFRDNNPPSGIWTSASADYGVSWGAPQRIATDCTRVNDVAATADGFLVVQLICADGPRANRAALVVRQPDGTWLPPEYLTIPVWYYSEGAVVTIGTGADARAVSLLLAGSGDVPRAFIASRRLSDTGAGQVAARTLVVPGRQLGPRMWHPRGLAYTRPDGTTAMTFTWADAERGTAYTMTSLDAGTTWGDVTSLAQPGSDGEQIAFVAPAYDVAADRLAAIWTCCGLDQWESSGTTHFASWGVPGGTWRTVTAPGGTGERLPLILGARSAYETVTAQSAGSRTAWIAWIEQQQRVEVRSLDLNQLIPVDQYPQPTATGGAP